MKEDFPEAAAVRRNADGNRDFFVRVRGRAWRISRTCNLEELWESMASEPGCLEDERLPYWTELWPASVALAGWLAHVQPKIAGRSCLDMGCGLGLTALVGQWLGARVTAMDYEEDALRCASDNARLNGMAPPQWVVMDWRRPAVRVGSQDCVWGGDIVYERGFASPVLRFLEHALKADGVAWLAEPGRSVYEFFLDALHGAGWQGRVVCEERVPPFYAEAVPVTVRVWELRRRVG